MSIIYIIYINLIQFTYRRIRCEKIWSSFDSTNELSSFWIVKYHGFPSCLQKLLDLFKQAD